MKRTEYMKEIKDLGLAELKDRARMLAQELMKLRFRKASGQLDQAFRIGQTRRNLARVQTLISKKAQAA